MKKFTNDKIVVLIGVFIIISGLFAFYPAKGKASVEKNESLIVHESKEIVHISPDGSYISIIGNPSPEQQEKIAAEMKNRNEIYRKDVYGEIFRKWKAGIEVDKYKNAWMLKNAAAPITVINTQPGSRPTAQTFPFESHSVFEEKNET